MVSTSAYALVPIEFASVRYPVFIRNLLAAGLYGKPDSLYFDSILWSLTCVQKSANPNKGQ